MADGILGLGSSGSTGLSQDVIDKLKEADGKAHVEPFTTKLETWDKELEKITEIETKVDELLSKIKSFDLYASGANAFEQVTASTTGTSAVFNAVDVSGLTPGSNSVNITQLAQRDVYQTSTFSDKDVQVADGNDSGDKISVTVAGTTYDFSTEGKTYQELADDMNLNEKLTVSVEQVEDNSYRMVIKSTDSGESNALTISQTGVALGISSQVKSATYANTAIQIDGGGDSGDKITVNGIDFTTEAKSIELLADDINDNSNFNASVSNGQLVITRVDNADVSIVETGVNMGFSSAVLTAQNMEAQVDGIDYDVSSNTITIQGNLTMTAIETGTSTISVQQDDSTIMPTLEDFVTTYNELVTLVDDELYSADSPIEDLGSLRMMMGSIKDMLFDSYGDTDEENIFNYGFSLDETGYMSLDAEIFGAAVSNNFDNLKELFIGKAEDEGLGTALKSYLDGLDSYDGLLSSYGERMADRKTTLEEDKEEAQTALDSKYSLMSLQFASYTAIITQMENSFGGMKMMMDQSTAS